MIIILPRKLWSDIGLPEEGSISNLDVIKLSKKKRYFRSKTEKLNITTEYFILFSN